MGGTETGYRLEEAGDGRVLVAMDPYVPHFVTHVVFARKQLVAENPAVVDRFLKGFFASIAWMKERTASTERAAGIRRSKRGQPRSSTTTSRFPVAFAAFRV